MRLGPISIHSELPVRIHRAKLREDKLEEFNSGKFARNDYTYLYELIIDKPPMFIQLATPSFRQILYSIRVLWHAYQGKPYDRHNHPVIMVAMDAQDAPMDLAYRSVKEQQQKKAQFQNMLRRNIRRYKRT